MEFTFAVEIHRAHIHYKYMNTVQDESTFIFLGGGRKCGKDHKVGKSELLLCRVEIQVYALVPFNTKNIWHL